MIRVMRYNLNKVPATVIMRHYLNKRVPADVVSCFSACNRRNFFDVAKISIIMVNHDTTKSSIATLKTYHILWCIP